MKCLVKLFILIAISILAWTGSCLAEAPKMQLTFSGHWEGGTQTLVKNLIAEYEKSNPDVKINFQYISVTGYLEKLTIMKAGGVMPDVMSIPARWIPELVGQGMLAPVPAVYQTRINQVYIPQSLAFARYRRALYGYPTENNVSAIVYNGETLDLAGLTRERPKNWTDIPALAKKLTITNADGTIRQAGFGLPGVSTGEPMIALLGSYVWGNGAKVLSADGDVTPYFDSPDVVKAVEFFSDMRAQGSAASRYSSTALSRKEAALLLPMSPYWRRGLVASMGDGYKQLGSWMVPSGHKRTATYQYGWVLGVSPDTRNAEEANKFASWLTMAVSEHGTTRMGEFYFNQGSLPVTKPDLSSYQAQLQRESFMSGFLTALLNSPIEIDPYISGITDFWKILAQGAVDAFSGKVSPVQSMTNAQRNALAIIKR